MNSKGMLIFVAVILVSLLLFSLETKVTNIILGITFVILLAAYLYIRNKNNRNEKK